LCRKRTFVLRLLASFAVITIDAWPSNDPMVPSWRGCYLPRK
jgi:hypothetical protein